MSFIHSNFFCFFSCADKKHEIKQEQKKHEIKQEQKDTTKVFGCMDTTMFNYNPLANTQPMLMYVFQNLILILHTIILKSKSLLALVF